MSKHLLQPPNRLIATIGEENGFTLVELMIVVVISALGFFLATPSYQQWSARSDLKQGISELHGALNLSRMMAMNQNTTVTVTLATVMGRVQYSNNAGILPTTLGNRVTAFAGGPVAFNSMGLRQGGGAGNQVITLTNSQGLVYSVVVTPGGKVNWCPTAVCS